MTKTMSNDENQLIGGENRLMTNENFDGPLIIVLDEDDEDDLEVLSIANKSQKVDDVSLQTKTDLIPQSPPKPVQDIPLNTKPIPRRKKPNKPPVQSTRPSSPIDSPLSHITFDHIPNILTISRMGSIYYCVEDIYWKIFSPLCSLDELISLLIKPEIVFLKEVTLSEKLCLTRENPRLKRFNATRYRLISIDASDYLLKIKQALLANKRVNKIIAEMRVYKQSSTNHSSHEKVGTKRPSTDDSSTNKRQKTVAQCQTSNLINNSIENIQINNILSDKSLSSRVFRSKSSTPNHENVQKSPAHSSSLPVLKLDMTSESPIDPSDNDFPVPKIVQIEENVSIDDFIEKPSPTSPPIVAKQSSSPVIPYPYVYQSPSFYLSPIRTPYNLYYPDSSPFPTTYQKSRESSVSNTKSDVSTKARSSPIITSLLEKPLEQLPSIPPHVAHSSSNTASLLQKKRAVLPECTVKPAPTYPPPKYQRVFLSPYPPTKTYFAPLSSHLSSVTEQIENDNACCTKTSLPHSRSISNQSVKLSRAIIDHQHCNIDQIPKLVIRHRKIYQTKTIDTMGQLFPSWFTEPDYRCIHCFTCDRVYTPQSFMTHIDDQKMINEQLIDMTSIQLLTSEKMSESKVHLWNTFCTNLTLFASKYAKGF